MGLRPYASLALVALLVLSGADAAKWSSFGFGRKAAPSVGRCYKICPPVVYPWGHDPYYDSPYFIHEQEMHGGPYGQGTLNPWGTNRVPVAGDVSHPVAGHWPGIRRPVVPLQAPTAMPESNPYPNMVAANEAPFSGPDTVNNRDLMFDKRAILEMGGNPEDFGPLNQAFIQLAARAGSAVTRSAYRGHPSREAWAAEVDADPLLHAATHRSPRKKLARKGGKAPLRKRPAAAAAGSDAETAFVEVAAGARHTPRKHFSPPCYHVCPSQDAPNEGDDPHGGPFGPDPYLSPQAKRMFRRHGRQNGIGPFYNPNSEPYGGPYGPDPYFEYGSHGTDRGSGQGNRQHGHTPIMGLP